jgi:HK97 family phage portal protein
MGLIRRRQPETGETRSYGDSQLGGLITYIGALMSRKSITVDEAVRQAAVWACVRVLTSTASGLPVGAVRKVGNERQPINPLPSVLASPSAIVTPDVWRAQVFWSLFTDGNAFGQVAQVSSLGYPTTIETINPTVVKDREVVDGVPQVKIDQKVHKFYPWGDIWHCPGVLVMPGSPFGLSPVEYAASSIRTAISAEDFGGGFFDDGGHPSSIISSDEEIDANEAKSIKAAFLRATRGNREPAVLGAGLEYKQIQVNPDDSQFIDLMRFEVENVARFFGVPPAMIYASVGGQNVTYANVSQADLHYLKHSIDTPLVRFEGALTSVLPKPQTALVNRGALLRADAMARSQEHEIRLRTKTRTVNEVRALEDEPPFPDPQFDEPGIPGGAESVIPPAQGGTVQKEPNL